MGWKRRIVVSSGVLPSLDQSAAVSQPTYPHSAGICRPKRTRKVLSKEDLSSLTSEYEVQGFIRRFVNLIESFATSSPA